MGAFRNSWDEASTAWVGDWTCSRLISPVDGCPEVGGKDQVAPLRSIIKTAVCTWLSGTIAKFLPLE